MMRMRYFIAVLGICIGLEIVPATAQHGDISFVLTERHVERRADSLFIHLVLDVSQVTIQSDHALVYTPILSVQNNSQPLPSIILNGKRRHILYQRLKRFDINEFAFRRKNGMAQKIDYQVGFPYESWMDEAEVGIITDDCGCGWASLQNSSEPLFPLHLKHPVEPLSPQLVYVTPEAEVVKNRSLEGRAYLDFPLDQILIYPQFRNNPVELAKIYESIESVRTDPFATIHSIRIKGYASPDGPYPHNAYLAEHRAQALLDYVSRLYAFEDILLQVDSEPEDWEGLTRLVQESQLPDKQELLEIIQAPLPKDWDQREQRLKRLNGGRSYQILLNEIYPALRHSDYVIGYTICNFTVEEACELAFTNPKVLSLNELFLVAQTLEVGSARFNELFETAVRLYPNDPVSNLNAAVTALRMGLVDKAEGYLANAAYCAEKQLAEAVLWMLQGRWKEAERRLETLLYEPSVSQAAQENLRQTKMRLLERNTSNIQNK